MQTPQEAKIRDIIEPSLSDMGYELVRVQLQGGRTRPILQIMAERSENGVMNIDDCEKVSKAVSILLDVEDPISEAYALEVSSPGIDRPLTRAKDFDKFKGFEAKVEAPGVVGARKRFQGMLRGLADNGSILLETDDPELGLMEIPFDHIEKAKLVLTDALIKAFAPTGEKISE